jgi:hypothetical protein
MMHPILAHIAKKARWKPRRPSKQSVSGATIENDASDTVLKLDAILSELKKLNKLIEQQVRIPSTPLRLKQMAVEDSARFISENMPDVMVMIYRHETVSYAAKRANIDGYFMEFGVNEGQTIRQIASLRPERKVFGFDSFEGLPEDWTGAGLLRGHFDQGGKLPAVPKNVKLVRGWFSDTLPKWKSRNKGPVSFVHVDSDLYSSAGTIFSELEERFIEGTIILFDEYFGYPNWRNGEHRAFTEMIERTGHTFRALAISHQALVVELGARLKS